MLLAAAAAKKSWQLIADGDLALPSARNAHTLPLTPDMAHDEAMFENTVSHSQHRVTFPTVKKSGCSDVVGGWLVSQVESFLASCFAPLQVRSC